MSRFLGALAVFCWAAALRPAFAQVDRIPSGLPPAAFDFEPAAFQPGEKQCPAGFFKNRVSDCWTSARDGDGRMLEAWVHPAGWLVDRRCFKDARFTRSQLVSALARAYRKMDPEVPAEKGGCLGTFNPDWGRELRDFFWKEPTIITCGPFKKSDSCAEQDDDEVQGVKVHTIEIEDVGDCMAENDDSTGLAGTFFHELLHADGADNVSTGEHNKAWERSQMDFIRDRVYGAEAVCFYGVNPDKRKLVHFEQCYNVVTFRTGHPKLDLCQSFDKSFTNVEKMPGFIKHHPQGR